MQRLRFDSLSRRQVQHHVAITRLQPGMRTFEHTHDFPELFLITSGAGIHERNGQAELVVPGMLSFVLASDVHRYVTTAHDLRFYNLALEPRWWTGFSALAGVKSDRAWTRQLSAGRQAEAAASLGELLAAAPPATTRLLETVANLWRLLMEGGLPAGTPRGGRARSPVPEWLARVVADWNDPELVREPIGFWQKRCGRSPEHFSRSCRRFLGAPPTELLNRARIERVKARLRLGDGKILELSLDAGFQNLGFFYRTFHRLEGCAPRAWLAKHAGASLVPR